MAAEPRIFTPPNPLARALGGLQTARARDLIAEAETKVALLSDTLRAHIGAQVAVILAFAGRDDAALLAEQQAIGEAALSVAEVAGAAGMAAIGEVAGGISAMIENARGSGTLHPEALKLHIHCLALVSEGGGSRTPENELVLAKLGAMRTAVGIVE